MNYSRRITPIAAIALANLLVTPVFAQSPEAIRIRELEKKLERSLELIDQLSAKVNRMEQASTSLQDSQAKATQQEAKITALQKHVSEIGSNLSNRPMDEGLPIHGFADVGIMKSNEKNVTTTGTKGAVLGTSLGTLDIYLTPRFGDRVKTLIELVFEAEQSGATEADLERMQIGYSFSDAATAWVGRFHTPFGYWNTAYHHGAQLQASILRPRFIDFEPDGGILPAHATGVWLTGNRNMERGKYGYDFFAANAPRINRVSTGSALAAAFRNGFSPTVNAGTYAGTGRLDARHGGDTTQRTLLGFNTWYEPAAIPGLRVGLHGLRGNVIDNATIFNETRLKMFGGYLAYYTGPWESIGEYYRFRNQDLSGGTGTHASWAGFAQVGYNIGNWTPFARAERSKLDQTDNYFGVLEGGRSYQRLAAGLRYDVDPKAALKVEFSTTRKEDLGPSITNRYPEFRFQYAIRF